MKTRLLLFDPYSTGHHAEYIRHILCGWMSRDMEGCVCAAVSPFLLDRHPDIRDLEIHTRRQSVRIITVPETAAWDAGEASLLQIGLQHRSVLNSLIRAHRPERILHLFLDHAQLALAARRRFRGDVAISGILFRASHHYSGDAGSHTRHWLTRLRKRFLLRQAFNHPQLDTVFSLDPTAVGPLQSLSRRARVVPLPDPLEPGPALIPPREVRNRYGIEPGRRMALLFGSIAERKGPLQLLRALKHLPDEDARRYAVVLAGNVSVDLRPTLHTEIRHLRRGPVQVVLSDEFIADELIQNLIRAADIVLLPYQRHVGSSGVLIRAAAAGRPVLAQDYGLIGHLVRTHRLGWAVDTTQPEIIASVLSTALRDEQITFDANTAAAFARANSVDSFIGILFGSLGIESSVHFPDAHRSVGRLRRRI